MSDRAKYRVASAEGRRTFERSMAVQLSDGERRVLEAIVSLTALYSKLVDEIAVSQIIDFTGLSKSTVLRSLHELKRHGLIRHEPPPPHSGSKAVSLIGLVSSSATPRVSSSDENGVIDDERLVSSPRSDSSHREVDSLDSTEKSSTEKKNRRRDDSAADAERTSPRQSQSQEPAPTGWGESRESSHTSSGAGERLTEALVEEVCDYITHHLSWDSTALFVEAYGKAEKVAGENSNIDLDVVTMGLLRANWTLLCDREPSQARLRPLLRYGKHAFEAISQGLAHSRSRPYAYAQTVAKQAAELEVEEQQQRAQAQ